jgi:fatty acid omega-hydroxylase
MSFCSFQNGMKIPAGTVCCYAPYHAGRRKELWDNPLEYNPERFIERNPDSGAAKVREVSPYKFDAFNAGPRTCLGKNVAILEASTCLAMLLSQYNFKLKPGHKVEYQNTLTLPMRHGLQMSVQTRK